MPSAESDQARANALVRRFTPFNIQLGKADTNRMSVFFCAHRASFELEGKSNDATSGMVCLGNGWFDPEPRRVLGALRVEFQRVVRADPATDRVCIRDEIRSQAYANAAQCRLFATLEAEFLGTTFEDRFEWLADLTRCLELYMIDREPTLWQGRDFSQDAGAGPGLTAMDQQQLRVAIRHAILDETGYDVQPPVELGGSREQLVRHFGRWEGRRFERRQRDRLTQIWEIDAFGNALWLITTRHPRS